jgi:hypothetical protein
VRRRAGGIVLGFAICGGGRCRIIGGRLADTSTGCRSDDFAGVGRNRRRTCGRQFRLDCRDRRDCCRGGGRGRRLDLARRPGIYLAVGRSRPVLRGTGGLPGRGRRCGYGCGTLGRCRCNRCLRRRCRFRRRARLSGLSAACAGCGLSGRGVRGGCRGDRYWARRFRGGRSR